MSHTVVKISIFYNKLCEIDGVIGKWHLVVFEDDPRTLCGGLAYADETKFTEKEITKGGITCEKCKERLRWYKSIKL